MAATFGFLAAVVFGFTHARSLAISGFVLGTLALTLSFIADKALPISVAPIKRHPLQPPTGQPIFTAWNAFSRVDVYELPAMPEEGRPDAGFGIIIDAGGSGTLALFLVGLQVGIWIFIGVGFIPIFPCYLFWVRWDCVGRRLIRPMVSYRTRSILCKWIPAFLSKNHRSPDRFLESTSVSLGAVSQESLGTHP